MQKKCVSVVIPVYNSAKTIERVLNSVIAQTAFEYILEVIVINDGSKDNSEEVIQVYMETHPELPIQYVKQKNQGASVARNHGIRIAKGEYIAFLDSDDLWLPRKIEVQMRLFAENSDMMFLGTGYMDKPFVRRGKKITGLFKANLKDLYWSYFPVTPSVVFKKEAIKTVGYFDENQHYGEDINYFQRFLIHFNYYYWPEKLVEIGLDKKFFASSGLSSNMSGMYHGELKNLRDLKQGKHITWLFYGCASIYITIKYWRRILIRKLRKILLKVRSDNA